MLQANLSVEKDAEIAALAEQLADKERGFARAQQEVDEQKEVRSRDLPSLSFK